MEKGSFKNIQVKVKSYNMLSNMKHLWFEDDI